jgi:superfamily II DNA/RNA helicase
VRHTVLRKRSTLEDRGLLDRIAVDIWPIEGQHLPMFDGQALLTSPEIDAACEAAEAFGRALAARMRGTGFMRGMLLQRICSSLASGLATAERLLAKRPEAREEEQNDEEPSLLAIGDVFGEERSQLEVIVKLLSRRPSDPKLEAVTHFLVEKNWLNLGCIVFSQYHDTARWVAASLTELLPNERIAVYAGADRSGLFLGGEWRSIEREDIKRAVRDRLVRLVVATDAACEGLNLQALGTLINIDLPWNPSRLEQRLGRIKRFGQRRDRVDMLNLVYGGTRDETIYAALSRRMRDRYDIFGALPDTLRDHWIDDIEHLEEHLEQYIRDRRAANAFDLRYEATIESEGPGWELCERVLARRDVIERMSEGW